MARSALWRNTRYDPQYPRSLSSMLKFIEDTFGLPSLTSFDGQSNDMFNAFNFNQTPLPPLVLQQRTCPPNNMYIPPQDDSD